MAPKPIRADTAYVYCSRETKQRIRKTKRGGERFDDTIAQMADSYQREDAGEEAKA